MSKTLEQIEQTIDLYEKELRSLDLVQTIGHSGNETILPLSKKTLKEFLLDWFYYNHLEVYDVGAGYTLLHHTLQIKNKGESTTNCHLNARRSVGDLFRLALNYFSPKITLYDVMKELYDLSKVITTVSKGKKAYGIVEMQLCGTIYRRTFYVRYGAKTSNYLFVSTSGQYDGSSYIKNEFNIRGEDYTKLFDTPEGKKFLENKFTPKVITTRPKATANTRTNSTIYNDIDQLVIEKLKSLKKVSLQK